MASMHRRRSQATTSSCAATRLSIELRRAIDIESTSTPHTKTIDDLCHTFGFASELDRARTLRLASDDARQRDDASVSIHIDRGGLDTIVERHLRFDLRRETGVADRALRLARANRYLLADLSTRLPRTRRIHTRLHAGRADRRIPIRATVAPAVSK